MKKFNNEENARLLKVRKITPGAPPPDALPAPAPQMDLETEQ